MVRCLRTLALYPKGAMMTKHLILLTDALPTAGRIPSRSSLLSRFVEECGNYYFYYWYPVDTQGKDLARKIVDIGGGRLYLLNNAVTLTQSFFKSTETRAVHGSLRVLRVSYSIILPLSP